MSRLFANGPGDRGSISSRVIPKTQKVVLDAALPSTQHFKVRAKDIGKQSWEWSSALPLHRRVVAIGKGAFGSPSTKVANFTFLYVCICQPHSHGRDVTQDPFLSGAFKIWIHSFLYPTLVTIPRVKSPICSTLYP